MSSIVQNQTTNSTVRAIVRPTLASKRNPVAVSVKDANLLASELEKRNFNKSDKFLKPKPEIDLDPEYEQCDSGSGVNDSVDREPSLMARELNEAIKQQNFRACPSHLKPVSDPGQYDDGGNLQDSSFEDEDADDYHNTRRMPVAHDQLIIQLKKNNKQLEKTNAVVKQIQRKMLKFEETYAPRLNGPMPGRTPAHSQSNLYDGDGYDYDAVGDGNPPVAENDDEYLYASNTTNQQNKPQRYNTPRPVKDILRDKRQETKNASKETVHLGTFLDYRKVDRIYTIIIHVVLSRDPSQLKSINGTKLFESKPFILYEDRGDPTITVDSVQWEPNSEEHKEEPNIVSLDTVWQGLPCEFKFIRQFKSKWLYSDIPKTIKFDVTVQQNKTPPTKLTVFADKAELKAENHRHNLLRKAAATSSYDDPQSADLQCPLYGISGQNPSCIDDLMYLVPAPPPDMRQPPINRAASTTNVFAQTPERRAEVHSSGSPHYTPLILNRPIPPIPSPLSDTPPPLAPRKSDSRFTVYPDYVNLPKPWK